MLFGCNPSNPQNEKLSDLESMQLKTSFVDLKNQKVDLSLYKGKKIIISYWATWCRPCVVEMPGLTKAQEILKNYNYTFLLVSDEKISKISKFKNDKKYNFNEKGMKIETIVGTIVWDSKQIIKKLKTL